MFAVQDDNSGRIKFTSRSRALVISNADPQKKGRIRVRHLLLGDSEWIPYLHTPGSFFVPKKGDIVYVECDAGYETHLVAFGNINKGLEEGSLEELPSVFQRISPTNQGFYSPGGHLIEIDDGKDLLGTDKGMRFTTSNGTFFKIDALKDSITAKVVFGDTWELSRARGFQVSTPAAGGTSLSMNGGKIDLNSTLDMSLGSTAGSVLISGTTSVDIITDSTATVAATVEASIGTSIGGAKLNISGGKVALGNNAGELLDLCDQHLDALINNASSIALTAVGPAQLNPAVVTSLTQIKTLLGLIKGSL